MDKKIFKVKISNGTPKSYETATTLELPATWAEFHDALEKARIKDARDCHNELTRIEYPGIQRGMIGDNVNLYELNLLAQRLTMLSKDDRMGLDGLLQIEGGQHIGPIPLPRLINLTYNADICLLAPQVSNNQELGALLYESEMLPLEAMILLDTTEEGSAYRKDLLEVFGKQHQEDHGGVFTRRGYVEPGGDFKEVYRRGEIMPYFNRTGAPVELEVTRSNAQESDSDQESRVILPLPAIQGAIPDVLKRAGAASLDECSFRCVECLVPSLRDPVDDTLKDVDGLEQVNEFAQSLAQKKRVWDAADRIKYKALLEAAGHPDLQDATELMHDLDQYELRPEIAEPWDYAEAVLREKYPDLPEELFQTPQAARIGQRMLEEDHAAITDYGLLRRKDGGQLPVFQRETQTMDGPQMGGM